MHTLGRAVLSVRGDAPNDVWVVGGPLGNTGFEALAMRYDGSVWHDLAPGGLDGYWWTTGTGPKDIWLVGEHGRTTHWDGAAFQELAPVTTATLYGAWAASPTDAWAVGGTTGGVPGPKDLVLHWDGASWTPVTLPGMPLGITLFKVWGSGPNDVYVVGEFSVVWHKKGDTWQREDVPIGVHGTLLTVGGCSANEVYAVGESNVLRSDGTTWTKLAVDLSSRVNGVACNAPGDVAIVGSGGVKQRLVGASWIDEADKPPFADLHAAWADGTGTFWAVGGDFVGPPDAGKAREGVVARYGRGHAGKTIVK